MKSSQLVLVLIALIAVGVAGLTVRAVSARSEGSVLSGLLPISPDVIDGVTIRDAAQEVELRKLNDVWRAEEYVAFELRLAALWSVVEQFDGAQLVANNPRNHERMGVDDQHGTEVIFFLGAAVQEKFIIGKWSPDVRLCYLRRQREGRVYAVPCPASDVFAPDADAWRDPIIITMPRDQVESLTLKYFEGKDVVDEFTIEIQDSTPVLTAEDVQEPANPYLVDLLLQVVEARLVASGFANEEDAQEIDFDLPDAWLRVASKEGSPYPTARIKFVKRADGDYYVRNTALPPVFIVDGELVDMFLRPREEYLGLPTGE